MERMSPQTHGAPDVSLIETMRLEHGRVVRRDGHLARAQASAQALDMPWKGAAIAAALDAAAASHAAGVRRVRLLVSGSGDPAVECGAFTHERERVWRVAIAAEPVASDDWSLRHKTTNREVYNRARAGRPDTDDVLLVNERGEITESTIANVVAELDGVRVTPPLACGLLPGVFRTALIDAGEIRERVLSASDLATASRLWLINSLREWISAVLVK
jgi:para-aminobenzoate synthetase/4-amino-4-deoxychorismate lyase